MIVSALSKFLKPILRALTGGAVPFPWMRWTGSPAVVRKEISSLNLRCLLWEPLGSTRRRSAVTVRFHVYVGDKNSKRWGAHYGRETGFNSELKPWNLTGLRSCWKIWYHTKLTKEVESLYVSRCQNWDQRYPTHTIENPFGYSINKNSFKNLQFFNLREYR